MPMNILSNNKANKEMVGPSVNCCWGPNHVKVVTSEGYWNKVNCFASGATLFLKYLSSGVLDKNSLLIKKQNKKTR